MSEIERCIDKTNGMDVEPDQIGIEVKIKERQETDNKIYM